jgi:hypothetical protein
MTTFRTTLQLGGKTATGFTVPAKVVESLGSGKLSVEGAKTAETRERRIAKALSALRAGKK